VGLNSLVRVPDDDRETACGVISYRERMHSRTVCVLLFAASAA